MINDYQHKRIPSPNPTTPARTAHQPSYSEAVESHLRRTGASTRLAEQLVTGSRGFITRAAAERRPAADIARILWTEHTNRLNHK